MRVRRTGLGNLSYGLSLPADVCPHRGRYPIVTAAPRGWRPSTIYGTRAAGCSFLLEVRRVNTHPPRLVFQLLSRLVLRGHDEERLRLLVDPREHLRDFLLHQPVRQLLDEQLPDGLVRHVGPSRDALHALDDECAGTGIDDLAQLAVLELEGDLLNLGRPGPGVS